MRNPLDLFLAAFLALTFTTCAPEADDPSPPSLALEAQASGTDVLLQAVGPVDARVVWVAGHGGTWVRTTDGGATWRTGVVAGADALEFRDVVGFDSLTAVLLSAGTGPLSRIFRSDDGGATWSERFVMDEPEGFLDCMDFWDAERGLAFGDAIADALYVLRTDDGGRSWARVDPATLPAALPGEGGFAASGSCLRTGADGRAWIATGNGARSRLLATADYGRSWSVVDLPLVGGEARGATTVGFRPDGTGFALGGIIGGAGTGPRVALSDDGGATWVAGGELALAGPVYGAAWIPGVDPPALVAVGPGGLDWSTDGGHRWQNADTTTWWAVAFASRDAGWATGPGGRIVRLRLPE